MPYSTTDELPESVKHVLPHHAQEIYLEAFNSAHTQYNDPKSRRENDDLEEVSHKVAWSAVKNTYEKGADEKWHPRQKGEN